MRTVTTAAVLALTLSLAACAGPKGVSLVAYADVRGPDDVKVLARIVK